jgi:hypothetical protein
MLAARELLKEIGDGLSVMGVRLTLGLSHWVYLEIWLVTSLMWRGAVGSLIPYKASSISLLLFRSYLSFWVLNFQRIKWFVICLRKSSILFILGITCLSYGSFLSLWKLRIFPGLPFMTFCLPVRAYKDSVWACWRLMLMQQ